MTNKPDPALFQFLTFKSIQLTQKRVLKSRETIPLTLVTTLAFLRRILGVRSLRFQKSSLK
jgi:hypothetical protein